jgi:hypothetical protein
MTQARRKADIRIAPGFRKLIAETITDVAGHHNHIETSLLRAQPVVEIPKLVLKALFQIPNDIRNF